jgi:assimilatory nitrate reductase catalytic subunit
MTAIRTTCPYCGVGCGLVVSNGTIAGDPDHPSNFGRLCSKGAALAETLDDSRRLLTPAIDGMAADWDTALDLIAARFSDAIARHGPDSVAFYVSGQFLTEDYYVANKLMKGFIGSGNIDTNSRLCMASSVSGHVRAFGEDIVAGVYEDWDEADLVVLVGSNTAWCHPVLYQRLMAARAMRGTRIVVVDPRRTATCETADLHLPLAPGSDVALFAGLLVHLADHGVLDQDWFAAHTNGFDACLAAARQTAGSIEQVAAITDLPAANIEAFYRLFAQTERSLTVYSQGVNQSTAGTDKVNAIINCHLATGRIGRPGMGPFSLTGQPNAMGGREVGGLANQLAAHMGFDPDAVDRVGRFWKAPTVAAKSGLKAVDLFDAMLEGQIQAVWIAATNPAASMPRAGRVRRALQACPFVVVSDCWTTDTTKYADVVLPAAGWGEKDGTVTNSERRILHQRAFRAPPGEAKPDWWMFAEVARRMGWTKAFSYDGPAAIFAEHARLSAFENGGDRLFDLGGLADRQDHEDFGPVQWPAPRNAPPGGRLFADGKFPTVDGRARFVPTPCRVPSPKADRRRPFCLNTGRVRDQWHTMTRTGFVPRLMSHQAEPFLELNPSDADRLCVEDGDLVRAETAEAAAIFCARRSDAVRRGEVFAPMHWSDDFSRQGPVARLVTGACDPVSGQPELKITPIRLAPVPTLWRGLAAGVSSPLPVAHYGIRVPTDHGDLQELRGYEHLPDRATIEHWAEAILGGIPKTAIDETRGNFRFAVADNGRLTGFLLLSRSRRWPVPGRGEVAPLLGQPFDATAENTLFLLQEVHEPHPADRTVCTCFGVGCSTIEGAIRGQNLRTSAQIGTALRAGTNCGSCLPEIEHILHAVLAQEAA